MIFLIKMNKTKECLFHLILIWGHSPRKEFVSVSKDLRYFKMKFKIFFEANTCSYPDCFWEIGSIFHL